MESIHRKFWNLKAYSQIRVPDSVISRCSCKKQKSKILAYSDYATLIFMLKLLLDLIINHIIDKSAKYKPSPCICFWISCFLSLSHQINTKSPKPYNFCTPSTQIGFLIRISRAVGVAEHVSK